MIAMPDAGAMRRGLVSPIGRRASSIAGQPGGSARTGSKKFYRKKNFTPALAKVFRVEYLAPEPCVPASGTSHLNRKGRKGKQ
jgi:hypothetical protein